MIIYRQTLRLRKICSERKGLKFHLEDLKRWFLSRCYPQRVAKEQGDRVLRRPLEHDTPKIKIQMVFHELLLIIPHLGIYERHCRKTLLFST